MPKNNDDNSAFFGIGAFLIGAMIAQPSQEKTRKLNEFQHNEPLFNQFKYSYDDFIVYLEERSLFDEFKNEQFLINRRLQNLGELKISERLKNDQQIIGYFDEALHLYLKGHFKYSCVSCAILIEILLKKRFGDKRFVDLINEASKADIITKSDTHHLQAIRLDRNDYVHSIGQEVSEVDSKIILLISIKIINKIV